MNMQPFVKVLGSRMTIFALVLTANMTANAYNEVSRRSGPGLPSVRSGATPRPNQCRDALQTTSDLQALTESRYQEWSQRFQKLFPQTEVRAKEKTFDAIQTRTAQLRPEEIAELKTLLRESSLEINLRKYDHRGMKQLKRLFDQLGSALANAGPFFRERVHAGDTAEAAYGEFLAARQKELGLPRTYDAGRVLEAARWLQDQLKTKMSQNAEVKDWRVFMYGSTVMGKALLPASDLDIIEPTNPATREFMKSLEHHEHVTGALGFDHLAVNRPTPETNMALPSTLSPLFIEVTVDRIDLLVAEIPVYSEAVAGRAPFKFDRYTLTH